MKYGIKNLQTIFNRDRNCSYCGKEMIFPYNCNKRTDSATIEHLNYDGPFFVKDGLKEQDIVIVCGSCNSSRGKKKLTDWFSSDYCKVNTINENTVSSIVKDYIKRNLNK